MVAELAGVHRTNVGEFKNNAVRDNTTLGIPGGGRPEGIVYKKVDLIKVERNQFRFDRILFME